MKFQLLIKLLNAESKEISCIKTSRCCIYHVYKCLIANKCLHCNILGQKKIMFIWVDRVKSFIVLWHDEFSQFMKTMDLSHNAKGHSSNMLTHLPSEAKGPNFSLSLYFVCASSLKFKQECVHGQDRLCCHCSYIMWYMPILINWQFNNIVIIWSSVAHLVEC